MAPIVSPIVKAKALEYFRWLMTTKNGQRALSAGLIGIVVVSSVGGSKKKSSSTSEQSNQAVTMRRKASINGEFLTKLRRIIKIIIPSYKSKEFIILFLHTAFLFSRTFLSIQVAKLDGAIVKSVVSGNVKAFVRNLGIWILFAIPATFVNSMIRYLESRLALAFRTRLSQHLYDVYMTDEIFYRVLNLDGRLSNPDQCLTEDVSRFCSALAHLHSQLSKPVLDCILYTVELFSLATKNSGTGGFPSFVCAWFTVWLTGRVLKFISPPFGSLVAEQARLEGDLRASHTRLITYAEEVAFYGGAPIEKGILNRCYSNLAKHMSKIYRLRIFYNMMEGFMMKYVWSMVGNVMIVLPHINQSLQAQKNEDVVEDVSDRTKDFVTARGLMISSADAVERIMSSYKEVTELAGYTSRVHDLITVFDDVTKGIYQKTTVSDAKEITHKRGQVIDCDTIKFVQVPIVSPNGDILVDSLSFECDHGMHLLITGPNGCGKSSMFRTLGGLWPLYGGTLHKPPNHQLFYIPQKPYLCSGSLRDQIIYPDTIAQKNLNELDTQLDDIMKWVDLQHIVTREGGWSAVKVWQDVLSGGEKQRVAMARLFYHKPKYAILDECTSAVSIDVEGQMYQHAIDLGITLMTVTHRPTLWKYHKYLLRFDGQGSWEFSSLSADTLITLQEEKEQLEKQLAGIPNLQQRLKQINALIGGDDSNDEVESKPPVH